MAVADNMQIRLCEIVAQLLDRAAGIAQLHAAAQDFYDWCNAAIDRGADAMHRFSVDAMHRVSTALSTGTAISPADAARCILDFMRTAQLLRGLEMALTTAQQRFPGERINILYAGCGPFAPLALGMTSRFPATAIRFILLDIHQESLDSVRTLFETMELADYIGDYAHGDATSWQWPAELPLHLVLTETMQQALYREPQVAIAQNLVPQLCEGGLLVPENIRVEAVLCHTASEFERPRQVPLGVLMEINRQSLPDQLFQEIVLEAPDDLVPGLHCHLFTTINVFGNCILKVRESGLTYPKPLYELGKIRAGEVLTFQYQSGPTPQFQYRILETAE